MMLTSGYVAFEIRALRCVSHRLHDLFLLNIPDGPALRAVHLFGVHPWRPWQVRILPTAQQPEPGLRAFLDRWALETVDHVACVGKAVVAQVVGAGLAAFTAGAAHGDDLGVLVEAAFLQQLRFVLLNAIIDGLSGNTEIIGTGDKGAEAQGAG